jgi:hypothetical protein
MDYWICGLLDCWPGAGLRPIHPFIHSSIHPSIRSVSASICVHLWFQVEVMLDTNALSAWADADAALLRILPKDRL